MFVACWPEDCIHVESEEWEESSPTSSRASNSAATTLAAASEEFKCFMIDRLLVLAFGQLMNN